MTEAIVRLQADPSQGSQADRIGAVFHIRGLARLLHFCGPQAFKEQPLLNAFEAARAIMTVGALISKQRVFLDAEPWRIIPWARNPAFKTPQSELLDILIVIPGVLQSHASVDTLPQDSQSPYFELLGVIKDQLLKLYRWRWRWQARSGHEVGLQLEDHSPLPHLPGQLGRLQFRRFVAATELMLYNATLMWLLALLYKMDAMGAPQHIEDCAAAAATASDDDLSHTSFQPLRRPGAAVTLRDPALEVCRAFEWVTRHHKFSKEPTFLYLFPVGMAMPALRDDTQKLAWIRVLLDSSPVTASYGQDQNHAGFGFYLSREALLAPEVVQPQEPWQLFSQQDVLRLSV